MKMLRPAVLACVLTLAAACGSGGARTPATIGSADTTHMPPAASIDPNFAFGQNVIITGTGFRPHWLVSVVDTPVVWWNASSVPQQIVFDHEPVHSAIIPPGGRYTYLPSAAVSITYHSDAGQGFRGLLQVTPTGSP